MNPWSVFWRKGYSTTFGDYFKQGYEGAVSDWWQSKFSALPDDEVVMEVGCGNCSLLPILVKAGIKCQYIGVDRAKVRLSEVSEKSLNESEIEFRLHSKTPAEKIPEPDASIGLMASVFGIEYSDLDRSLQEVLRLLKPGGQFCALLHHDESVITSVSHQATSQYNRKEMDAVVKALKTISTARDNASSAADLASNPKAEQSRILINRMAEKYLSNPDPRTGNPSMFNFMSDALGFFKMMGASSLDRAKFISSLLKEHKASIALKKQMSSVAFDKGDIEIFEEGLRELGASQIDVEVLYEKNHVMAWGLTSNKKLENRHVEG